MEFKEAAFYEEMAAELLKTAMGCTDTRTRNRLVEWANVYVNRLVSECEADHAPRWLQFH